MFRESHSKTDPVYRLSFTVARSQHPYGDPPFDNEAAAKGEGVTRTCSACGHKWYLNRKIHTYKCLTCSRDKKHKKLDAHIVNSYNNTNAGVAELADAADLKSAGVILVGSSPTPGTVKAG